MLLLLWFCFSAAVCPQSCLSEVKSDHKHPVWIPNWKQNKVVEEVSEPDSYAVPFYGCSASPCNLPGDDWVRLDIMNETVFFVSFILFRPLFYHRETGNEQ